ncbi:MAG: putative MFS family arabinose efflux permease, partial [bacterium]
MKNAVLKEANLQNKTSKISWFRQKLHQSKNQILKLFGITEQEVLRVFTTAILFFMIRITFSFGDTLKNTYFIKMVGAANLPYAYLLTAFFTLITFLGYFRLSKLFGNHRFTYFQFLSLGIGIFCFYFTVPFKIKWLTYILFSYTDAFMLIALRHFWIIVSSTFDPREGKRIFPIIGGAGLLGIVVGGFTIGPSVKYLGIQTSFLVWSIMSLLTIPCIRWLKQSTKNFHPITYEAPEIKVQQVDKLKEKLNKVWAIPLVRSMSYATIPMILVVYFLDYQFFITMEQVYDKE